MIYISIILVIIFFIWVFYNFIRFFYSFIRFYYNKFTFTSKTSLPKDNDSLDPIIVKVKGTSYRTREEIAAARNVEIGDTLILKREPTNKEDRYAVKVYTIEGYHIGYIDRLYSEEISNNISYIKEAEVSSKRGHDIPYINIRVLFSDSPVEQREFIPKEFQLRPEDKMLALGTDEKVAQFERIRFPVKGLYEEGRKTVALARALKRGDKVVLKKGECDDYFPKRIDVFAENGVYLGYADKQLIGDEIYDRFDDIVRVMVDEHISQNTADRLFISAFLQKTNEDYTSKPPISVGITFTYSGDYPQVKFASNIRQTDPIAALDILLPIAKRERGIDAKLECIACYYQTKEWENRIDMIQKTIDRIDELTEEDFPKSELVTMQTQLPKLLKQLDFSNKRLESQMKKKKRK